MSASTAPPHAPRRQGAPPVLVLAGVSLALLVAAIAAGAALGGPFPSA